MVLMSTVICPHSIVVISKAGNKVKSRRRRFFGKVVKVFIVQVFFLLS
jgi:hypothetical protein